MMDSIKNAHIFINKNAGMVQKIGIRSLNSIIMDSPLQTARIECLAPKDLFNTVIQSSPDEPILIGGGDGTIRGLAPHFMKHKRPFGILPLGTMNLLAKDLGIPENLQDCLDGYARSPQTITMDVGLVNEHVFLCCAGLGTMPESAKFREKKRAQNDFMMLSQLTVFVLKQMDSLRRRTITIDIDGQTQKLRTSAIVISDNPYANADQTTLLQNFDRPHLDKGKLGIYAATPTCLWDKVRILLRLHVGHWQEDKVIDRWIGQNVTIRTKRSKELVSLDGETMRLKTPLHFKINPQSLSIWTPCPTDEHKA